MADLFKHLLCNLHGGVAATESRCAPHRPAVAPSHTPFAPALRFIHPVAPASSSAAHQSRGGAT